MSPIGAPAPILGVAVRASTNGPGISTPAGGAKNSQGKIGAISTLPISTGSHVSSVVCRRKARALLP